MKTKARSVQTEKAKIDLKDEWLGVFVATGLFQEQLRLLLQTVKAPGEKKAVTAMLNKLGRFEKYANAAAKAQ